MFDVETYGNLTDEQRDEITTEWLKTHDITYCPPGARTEGFEDAYLRDPFLVDDTNPADDLRAIKPSGVYMASRPNFDDDDYVPPKFARGLR